MTFLDLENLSRILDRQPISIAAAASLLSVQRAYLYRLMQRINRIIGDPAPEWRHRKGLVLPVEVRRLVRAYRVFHDSQEDLVRFPRVSAGSGASLLLSSYLEKAGQETGRLMVVRSRDAALALQSEEIDVALGHESAFGGTPGRGLESKRLLQWSSVEVRPNRESRRARAELAWEPGSLGAQLNVYDGRPFSRKAGGIIFHVTSFSHALELTRRGIIDSVVLPDIYVSGSDRQELTVARPAREHQDHLIALFRAGDGQRLDWLLDPAIWASIQARAL